MNMFARIDENPAMTLQDIKEAIRYGRTDGRTDGQRENSIPTTNKVCGGGGGGGWGINKKKYFLQCENHVNVYYSKFNTNITQPFDSYNCIE